LNRRMFHKPCRVGRGPFLTISRIACGLGFVPQTEEQTLRETNVAVTSFWKVRIPINSAVESEGSRPGVTIERGHLRRASAAG
jgi:hypothetical protein